MFFQGKEGETKLRQKPHSLSNIISKLDLQVFATQNSHHEVYTLKERVQREILCCMVFR